MNNTISHGFCQDSMDGQKRPICEANVGGFGEFRKRVKTVGEAAERGSAVEDLATGVLMTMTEAESSKASSENLLCLEIEDAAAKGMSVPYMKELGNDMVNLYVGPERVRFQIQKGRLCARIPYFENMFKIGMRESLEDYAILEDLDPEAFDLLMEWVFSGTVRLTNKGPCFCANRDTCSDIKHTRWGATEFYMLADYFCLTELKDRIMDEHRRFHREHRRMSSPRTMEECYRKTVDGSQLRNYEAQSLAYVCRLSGNEGGCFNLANISRVIARNQELRQDFLKLIRVHNGLVPDPRESDPCDFHSHKKGEKCSLA